MKLDKVTGDVLRALAREQDDIARQLAGQSDPDHIPSVPEPDDTADLRIKLSEARTDTKFAELIGEMRVGFAAMNGRLDHLDQTNQEFSKTVSGAKTTTIVTGLAVVAAVIAILTYGQGWFGAGIAARDAARAEIASYSEQHPPSPPVAPIAPAPVAPLPPTPNK